MQKIVFSKFSNERARRFAIRTDIVSDESKQLSVFKRNLYPEGQQHIKNIYRWYEELSKVYEGTQIELNRCEYLGDKVSLEYLRQLTLEHELNELLRKRRFDQFNNLLFSYIDEVKKGDMIHPFVKTEAFVETFGDVTVDDSLSAKVTNIDMVLNNVILGEKWTIIDYEWTFDFPVPANFAVYRILHYFIASTPYQALLNSDELFEQVGISAEEQEIYAAMEKHFQMNFLLTDVKEKQPLVPIRELHEDISPGGIDLKRIYSEAQMHKSAVVQVFFSDQYDFSEENSSTIHCNIDEKVTIELELQPDTDFLRLDPHELSCSLSELEVVDDKGEAVPVFTTNGITIKENRVIFLADDPQLIFSGLKEKTKLTISYQLQLIDAREKNVFESILEEAITLTDTISHMKQEYQQIEAENNQYQQVIQEKENQISHQAQVITNMENTKIWKAYEQYKKTFRKS